VRTLFSRKDVEMNKQYPPEFKRDVVALAKRGEITKRQIAKDVGISETTLHRWIRRVEIDEGEREGATSDEREELRELRKRARRLEQENEILRRAAAYFAKDALPK
jgi:transposase